jgi:Ni/Co efflux regulator RcnB
MAQQWRWGALGHASSDIGRPANQSLHKDNTMNKLLAALVAALFSAGAFAQASAPAAPAAPAATPAPAASAPATGEKNAHHHKKKKKRDHRPKQQDKSAYGVGN